MGILGQVSIGIAAVSFGAIVGAMIIARRQGRVLLWWPDLVPRYRKQLEHVDALYAGIVQTETGIWVWYLDPMSKRPSLAVEREIIRVSELLRETESRIDNWRGSCRANFEVGDWRAYEAHSAQQRELVRKLLALKEGVRYLTEAIQSGDTLALEKASVVFETKPSTTWIAVNQGGSDVS